MDRDECIRLLASMLGGLAVPYSVAKRLLGTAGPAWSALWDGLGLMGYPPDEEIQAALRKVLDA